MNRIKILYDLISYFVLYLFINIRRTKEPDPYSIMNKDKVITSHYRDISEAIYILKSILEADSQDDYVKIIELKPIYTGVAPYIRYSNFLSHNGYKFKDYTKELKDLKIVLLKLKIKYSFLLLRNEYSGFKLRTIIPYIRSVESLLASMSE